MARPRARLAAVLALTLAAQGCRDSAYAAASKADTIEGWRRFVTQHPKDDNLDAAKARLAELELERARAVHTVLAYKRFLEEFPDEEQARPALALLEGLRFNAAQEMGTASAMRQFLRDHPDGARREEAEARLAALELAELSTVADPARLAAAAAKSPDDPRSEKASARLDDVAFAEAGTAARLYAYLRDFPSGAHRDEAKTRLLSLEVDALLVSGLLEQARALVKQSPLGKAVAGFPARAQRAEAVRALPKARDERVRRALAAYHLRPVAELVRSLSAPDPMDRWQAAEELGAHTSVEVIDPLLEAFRSARAPLVRQRAFDSLARVLRSLPRPVAEFEVARRREGLAERASDAQLYLAGAVLLDLSGQLEDAAAEYRRAWSDDAPDPVVLRRWAEIRRERGQAFSAAVAARQLSTWASGVAQGAGPFGPTNALAASRELCAAAEAARWALTVIDEAKGPKTEFPEDVEAFSRRARDALRLTEARLRDAELALLTLDSGARRCGDEAVRERLEASDQSRAALVAELRERPPRDPKELSVLLDALAEADPSPAVRAAARR